MCILVVTNSDDPTADFVFERAGELGFELYRFNTDQTILGMKQEFWLTSNLLELSVREGAVNVPLDEICGIWYRRPVEPEVDEALQSEQARDYAREEAYYYLKCLWKMLEDRTWVSYPWAISWASVKLHQLRRAQSLGFNVPETLATNDPKEARRFWEELDGKIVVKPFEANVLEYGNRTPVIYTSRMTVDDLERLENVKYTITLFQEEIEKHLEVRVTVIGNEVFCSAIDSQANPDTELDWRRTSNELNKWQHFDLPDSMVKRCWELVHGYNLNFGAIDLAATSEGEFVFFELNPNGQWAWQEIELGLPMTRSLLRFLSSGGC